MRREQQLSAGAVTIVAAHVSCLPAVKTNTVTRYHVQCSADQSTLEQVQVAALPSPPLEEYET
jgi:hypothetical protein